MAATPNVKIIVKLMLWKNVLTKKMLIYRTFQFLSLPIVRSNAYNQLKPISPENLTTMFALPTAPLLYVT